MAFVIAIHVLACVFLIILILIQAGRGGGLIDNLSSMESMLGTKTSAFLTKTTSVLAILFFLTCLTLAFLSLKQSRSLMRGVKPEKAAAAATTATKETAPAEQLPVAAATTPAQASDAAPQTSVASVAPQQSVTQQNSATHTSSTTQQNTAAQQK